MLIMPTPLVTIAAVVVLGIGAQWLAWRTKFPSILLLLGFGSVSAAHHTIAIIEMTVSIEQTMPLGVTPMFSSRIQIAS